MVGASVIKTSELFGVGRSTVLKVMKSFENERKTFSLKQNFERKRKLSNRDRRNRTQIFREDHKNTVPETTAEVNDNLENPVSSKTVRRELHTAGFHGRGCNQKTILNKLVWNFQVFPLFCSTLHIIWHHIIYYMTSYDVISNLIKSYHLFITLYNIVTYNVIYQISHHFISHPVTWYITS